MKLKTTLLAAAATLAISPAANAYQGVYGAIGAGLTLMQGDRDVSNDGAGAGGPLIFDSSADYDNGIGVYSALGYDFGNNWRTELELSYRNNEIDSIAADGAGFSGWPSGTISGDSQSLALMLNVLRDFEVGGRFKPYIGGGIGVADVNHDIAGNNPAGVPFAPMSITYGPHKRLFAYQGIAGVAYELTEGLALDLSYRFFGTEKKTVDGTFNGLPSAYAVGHHVHSIFAGLRWNFGAASGPVAPQYKDCWDGSSVPVSAECPPQLIEDQTVDLDPVAFTVYFDYDKSNLSDQASDLIARAAAEALANDIDTVVVQGNTDTSGSSAYNQTLSERRARVVRDALIANNIPADAIRVEAFGETNPAKPTADGVKEPLNRRSDVTISFE